MLREIGISQGQPYEGGEVAAETKQHELVQQWHDKIASDLAIDQRNSERLPQRKTYRENR